MISVIKKYDIQSIERNVRLLNEFENYKLNGLYASDIQRLKEENTDLFNSVMSYINMGRWNPFVGMWTGESKYYSEEALCRSILYSCAAVGKNYRVMYAADCYSGSLAKCAYAGRFDAVIIENAINNYWLESTDGSRVLALCPENFVDSDGITEQTIKENAFITLEEYAAQTLCAPLDLPTVVTQADVMPFTEDEKAILHYEAAQWDNKNVNEAVKNMWLNKAAVPMTQAQPCSVNIDVSGVQLVAFKRSEDGKGDTVIRVKETEGCEKSVRLMCEEIEAAFRFEILPYETITFRIDKEGFVTETFIQE